MNEVNYKLKKFNLIFKIQLNINILYKYNSFYLVNNSFIIYKNNENKIFKN